jgi:hypothetical protein
VVAENGGSVRVTATNLKTIIQLSLLVKAVRQKHSWRNYHTTIGCGMPVAGSCLIIIIVISLDAFSTGSQLFVLCTPQTDTTHDIFAQGILKDPISSSSSLRFCVD